jgi:hypothetical protein
MTIYNLGEELSSGDELKLQLADIAHSGIGPTPSEEIRGLFSNDILKRGNVSSLSDSTKYFLKNKSGSSLTSLDYQIKDLEEPLISPLLNYEIEQGIKANTAHLHGSKIIKEDGEFTYLANGDVILSNNGDLLAGPSKDLMDIERRISFAKTMGIISTDEPSLSLATEIALLEIMGVSKKRH